METHYIVTQSTVWYKALQGMIAEYNSEFHKSIGMSPNEAIKPENYAKVYEKQYAKGSKIKQSKKSPLKIGDRVRISLHKRLFEKGSTANWSEEIFQIVGIMKDYRPMVYRLEDLTGEEFIRTYRSEDFFGSQLLRRLMPADAPNRARAPSEVHIGMR